MFIIIKLDNIRNRLLTYQSVKMKLEKYKITKIRAPDSYILDIIFRTEEIF